MKRGHTGLFVWRDTVPIEGDFNATDRFLRFAGEKCPFCKTKYHYQQHDEYGPLGKRTHTVEYEESEHCKLCGFGYKHEFHSTHHFANSDVIASALRRFDLDDARVGLDELGSYLKSNFSDVYTISSRRFEELVADVYRQLGYRARLTQQTRDGGYDIVLLERSAAEQVIVECKRYSPKRKVGVEVVRSLLGVQLEVGVRRAKIVTTTTFSEPAKQTVDRILHGSSGFSVELVDAEELVRALNVYNRNLPSLDSVMSLSREHLLDLVRDSN